MATSNKSVFGKVALLLGVAIPLWLAFGMRPDSQKVSEVYTDAKVLSVNEKAVQDRFGGMSGLAIGMVEIADGKRARIWMRAPFPKPGDTLRVRLATYEDGRQVVFSGDVNQTPP